MRARQGAGSRASGLPPREHDLDDVGTDLAQDGVRDVRRDPRLEGRRHAPRATRGARKLEDDRRLSRELLQYLLDALEDRDRPLVIERLAEADHELRRPGRNGGRRRHRGPRGRTRCQGAGSFAVPTPVPAAAGPNEASPLREPLPRLVEDALDLAEPVVIEADRVLDQELRRVVALLDAAEDQQDLVGVPDRGSRVVRAREDRGLDRSGEILDLREHHELLLLARDVLARARHHAGDDDESLILFLFERYQRLDVEIDLLVQHLLQRVLREIDAEHLLLPREELLARRFHAAERRRGRYLARESKPVEETDLAARAVLLLAL